MRQPRILMCPPDYYGIEYEINPWMSRSRGSDRPTAATQWEGLVAILRELGAVVELMTARQGLPDLVFTANAGLMFRDRFYSSSFRHEERARESPVFDEWFAAHGFSVHHMPEGTFHEGAGDALFCGDALFAGYRIRSDVYAHQWLAREIGVRVLPLELIDPYYYHLDTCFCPVAPDTAIWFPPAFDAYGQKVIRTHVPKLIACEPDEAKRFGCNAVAVGKTVVTNSGCPRLAESLEKLGYATRNTPLDEFLKAGGSAKCLTLRLDGEEAANWAK
ncbi:MAG: amidinotransferase [Gemmataceae bacterium]|nr:amidinotransferase [Gemmataceae bacterium]